MTDGEVIGAIVVVGGIGAAAWWWSRRSAAAAAAAGSVAAPTNLVADPPPAPVLRTLTAQNVIAESGPLTVSANALALLAPPPAAPAAPSAAATVATDVVKFGLLPVTATIAAVKYVPGVKQATGAAVHLAKGALGTISGGVTAIGHLF